MLALPLAVACQSSPTVNNADMQTFLNELCKNATVTITDKTERDRQPATQFHIVTKFPLSGAQLTAYRKNGGTLMNNDDDIANRVTYIIKGYTLTNEKNEQLTFPDTGKPDHLQLYGITGDDSVPHQSLGMKITLHKTFEKLQGHIVCEFTAPGGTKKEVKIPVNISIQDNVTE